MFSAGADLQSMLPGLCMMGGAAAMEGAEPSCRRPCSKCAMPRARGRRRGIAWVVAVAGRPRARRVLPWKATWARWKWAWAWCPAPAADHIARRAAENALSALARTCPLPDRRLHRRSHGQVGTSALESRSLGYLLDSDVVVPHKDELLFTAISEAKAMYTGGYRPRTARLFPVAGRSGKATIQGAAAVNMRDGGFISATTSTSPG